MDAYCPINWKKFIEDISRTAVEENDVKKSKLILIITALEIRCSFDSRNSNICT